MKKALATVIAALAVFATYNSRAEEAGHEGHAHGADEKTATLTIKDVAAIKFAHDEKDGKVTLTVTGPDKKALKPAAPPRLNLMVDGKRKQLKTKALESAKDGNVFVAEDAVLKGKLNGQVSLKIGDKTHKVEIDPHAGHDHGSDDHSGHNH